MHYLYLLGDKNRQFFKIGISNNPVDRVRRINSWSGRNARIARQFNLTMELIHTISFPNELNIRKAEVSLANWIARDRHFRMINHSEYFICYPEADDSYQRIDNDNIQRVIDMMNTISERGPNIAPNVNISDFYFGKNPPENYLEFLRYQYGGKIAPCLCSAPDLPNTRLPIELV